MDPSELREPLGLSRRGLAAALALLERAGALEVLPGGGVVARPGVDPAAAEEAADAEEAHRRMERTRVEMVRSYAEARDCRRRLLLAYFGEHLDGPCGRCDRCVGGARAGEGTGGDGTAAARGDGGFRPGQRVTHAAWGPGEVVQAGDGALVVRFEEAGYRTLDAGLVAERALLAPRD